MPRKFAQFSLVRFLRSLVQRVLNRNSTGRKRPKPLLTSGETRFWLCVARAELQWPHAERQPFLSDGLTESLIRLQIKEESASPAVGPRHRSQKVCIV